VCTKGNRFCPGLLQAHGIAAVQSVMRLDITSVKVWSRKRSERTGRRLVQAGGELRSTVLTLTEQCLLYLVLSWYKILLA
jgi:hypothetical protein